LERMISDASAQVGRIRELIGHRKANEQEGATDV
jgi:hypothetical protein